MYLVINKWVIAVNVSNFSGQYLRNHWTLDIGILGYIGIVWPKEHSPEVWSVPPVTTCIQHFFFMFCWPAALYYLVKKKSQLGAQFFLVCLLLFSTCFGRICAHHREKQLCLCVTWYLLFYVDGCLVCRVDDDGHIVAQNM